MNDQMIEPIQPQMRQNDHIAMYFRKFVNPFKTKELLLFLRCCLMVARKVLNMEFSQRVDFPPICRWPFFPASWPGFPHPAKGHFFFVRFA
jgi:hypothetical protein